MRAALQTLSRVHWHRSPTQHCVTSENKQIAVFRREDKILTAVMLSVGRGGSPTLVLTHSLPQFLHLSNGLGAALCDPHSRYPGDMAGPVGVSVILPSASSQTAVSQPCTSKPGQGREPLGEGGGVCVG